MTESESVALPLGDTPVTEGFFRISERAQSYGIPGVTVDGNDPDAVAQVMREAVARARAGEGPTLVEALLGRMRGHGLRRY